MYERPQMEIPEPVRHMAERNVEQARTAYGQFMEMARQAQSLMSRSSGAMAESVAEIQARTLRFAEQNMEAGFQFASELARARDLKEYVEIQSRHAQRQMQTYAQQAQELGRMMSELAQRSQAKP
ncbi:MAG: phasin family protein [Hyphomicrobiaceae bacterium]|nr:phasin family protein [Hyphomicrobiaceae bacterium]